MQDKSSVQKLSIYQYLQISKVQSQYRSQFGVEKRDASLQFEYPRHHWQA